MAFLDWLNRNLNPFSANDALASPMLAQPNAQQDTYAPLAQGNRDYLAQVYERPAPAQREPVTIQDAPDMQQDNSSSFGGRDFLKLLGAAAAGFAGPEYAKMYLEQINPASNQKSNGATDAIVRQIMADNPGMTYTEALALYQGGMGLRNGMVRTADGRIVAAPGYAQVLKDTKQAGETGVQIAKQQYEPTTRRLTEQAAADVQIGTANRIAQETAAGTATGKSIGEQGSNASKFDTTLSYIDEAKGILPKASGSGYEAYLVNPAKAFAGVSDDTTQANERLNLIGGWMTSNVPRMEGPQSNEDRLSYKEMAAKVGNSAVPIGDRLAALEQLQTLAKKYKDGYDQRLSKSRSSSSATATPAVTPDTPPTPQDIENQIRAMAAGSQGALIDAAPSAQPQPKRRRYNPTTGELE